MATKLIVNSGSWAGAWGTYWAGSWGIWGYAADGTPIEVYNPVALVPAGHWKHLFKHAYGVTTPEVKEERASAWRVALPEARTYVLETTTATVSHTCRSSFSVELPYLGTFTSRVGEECHAAFRVVAPRCFARTGFVTGSSRSLWNISVPYFGCGTPGRLGYCSSGYSVVVPKTITNPSEEMMMILVM